MPLNMDQDGKCIALTYQQRLQMKQDKWKENIFAKKNKSKDVE